MEIAGQVAIVTGGAQGIGAALARHLHKAGAAHVCVCDLDGDGAKTVAAEIGGTGMQVDVRDAGRIGAMIDEIEATQGPVGLMCSNAGIANGFDPAVTNAAGASAVEWQMAWEVNVMAHVHAANILAPRMIARGGGYFRVSILCPQGVATPMLSGIGGDGPQAGDGVLSAEAVAKAALDGIRDEQFLILPHPQVQAYMEAKVANYNRWIGGMAKFQRGFRAAK